jgi:hypothetical protein
MLFVFRDEAKKQIGIAFKKDGEWVSAWLPVQECLGLSAQLSISALSMVENIPDTFCYEVSGFKDIVHEYRVHSPLTAADFYCVNTGADYSVITVKVKL